MQRSANDSTRNARLRRTHALRWLAIGILLLLPAVGAGADPPGVSNSRPQQLRLPGSGGQRTLVVQVGTGRVRARGCAAGGRCSPYEEFPIATGTQLARVTLETIRLPRGRQLALVSAPGQQSGQRWVLLLAGSLAPEPPKAWKLLSGWLGRPKGQPGELETKALLRESVLGGEQVVTGTQYQHVTACGRAATIATRQLDPATLEWKRSGARSLSADERARATPLVAKRSSAPAQTSPVLPWLLRPVVASSAAGSTAGGIADGNPATHWAEGRPGPGAGELVMLAAAKAVPILGFELILRPTSPAPAKDDGSADPGMAPRTLHLVAEEQLFQITMPEDAWQQPAGTRYEITLPAPLRTDCVTVVLDEAYPRNGGSQVTIAELAARTALDELRTKPAELVAELDSAPERAQAVAALLIRGGEPALAATMAEYSQLGAEGRERALAVIDSGPCSSTASFYVELLLRQAAPAAPPATAKPNTPALPGRRGRAPAAADSEGLLEHAQSRLRECGRAAAQPLARVVANEAPGERQVLAGHELALVAPGSAVPALLDVLDRGPDEIRSELRAALATAARSRTARRTVAQQLAPAAFGARSLVARIDLLRAIGPELGSFAESGPALRGVLASDQSFRTRYLLQIPAGQLAQQGDEAALEFLRQSLLHDASPHVRAQAARASGGLTALGPDLARALGDSQPRTRQAALQALNTGTTPLTAQTEAHIARLLGSDPWSFVRSQAARALSERPAAAPTDQVLVAALQDESRRVRRAALLALGKRNAPATVDAVRDVADQPRETVSVRVAAITALGAMCDFDSVDLLTKLALRAGAAVIPYDRPLGLASLGALRALHPPDLRERLTPLLSPKAPLAIRQLANQALREQGSCSKGEAP